MEQLESMRHLHHRLNRHIHRKAHRVNHVQVRMLQQNNRRNFQVVEHPHLIIMIYQVGQIVSMVNFRISISFLD